MKRAADYLVGDAVDLLIEEHQEQNYSKIRSQYEDDLLETDDRYNIETISEVND